MVLEIDPWIAFTVHYQCKGGFQLESTLSSKVTCLLDGEKTVWSNTDQIKCVPITGMRLAIISPCEMDFPNDLLIEVLHSSCCEQYF